jgi:hypothetical protein
VLFVLEVEFVAVELFPLVVFAVELLAFVVFVGTVVLVDVVLVFAVVFVADVEFAVDVELVFVELEGIVVFVLLVELEVDVELVLVELLDVVLFVVVLVFTGSTITIDGSLGPVVEKYSVALPMLMTRMYRLFIKVVFLVTLNLKFFFMLFRSTKVPLFAPKGYFDWKNSKF